MVAQHPGKTYFYTAHLLHVPGLGLALSRCRQNCLLVAFGLFREISAALICIFHPVLSLNVSVSVMNVQGYCVCFKARPLIHPQVLCGEEALTS